MGFFDNLFSSNPKKLSEMSDKELTREVQRPMKHGDTPASRARAAMEAEKRGIAWRQSEWDKKYKD